MDITRTRGTAIRWLTGAMVATAASVLIAPTSAVAATAPPSLQAPMAPDQTGYDGYLCNIASLWIRQAPNDGAVGIAQVFTGNPMHVYRTHNSDPSIPAGWALGYGRPGGGAAVDGYFKVGYVCT
ncbi:hypothetical protein [Streptomyces odontomachi]|uniref:hypothetical protein n=1 Tax=Streptomyces odontomachi TaxID=2944940 RepID=UPI00210E7E16|nr:hypothetical protein [Streptomyces sp. ODS25]